MAQTRTTNVHSLLEASTQTTSAIMRTSFKASATSTWVRKNNTGVP